MFKSLVCAFRKYGSGQCSRGGVHKKGSLTGGVEVGVGGGGGGIVSVGNRGCGL